MAQTHDPYASVLKQIQIASLEATSSLLGHAYTQPKQVINRVLRELHHRLQKELTLPGLELFTDYIDTKWIRSSDGSCGERFSHCKFVFRLDRYFKNCKHYIYGSIVTDHQDGSFLIHGVNVNISSVIGHLIDEVSFLDNLRFARRYIEDMQSTLRMIRTGASVHNPLLSLQLLGDRLKDRIHKIWDHCKWENPNLTICQFARLIKTLLNYNGSRKIYFHADQNRLIVIFNHKGREEHRWVISLDPHL